MSFDLDPFMIQSTDTTAPRPRSTTGCWTCRVRRKKCDERPGKCATCSALRLRCAGYGDRPTWMDGGVREKQKVDELKGQIKRRRKRASHSPRQAVRDAPHTPRHSSPHNASWMPRPPRVVTEPWPSPDVHLLPTPPLLSPSDVWTTQLSSPTVTDETADYVSHASLFETLHPVLQFNKQHWQAPLSIDKNDDMPGSVPELDLATDMGLTTTEEWISLLTPAMDGTELAMGGLESLSATAVGPEYATPHDDTANETRMPDSNIADALPEEASRSDDGCVSRDTCIEMAAMDELVHVCPEYDNPLRKDTATGMPDTPCSASWAAQSDIPPSLEAFVADRFPYMAADIRANLRERMLWPHDATQEIVQASTRAILGDLRSRSLRRWSLCSDVATIPRPDLETAFCMLPDKIHPPMPSTCMEELVTAILQMVLLQIDDGRLTRNCLDKTANFFKGHCLSTDTAQDSIINLSYGFIVAAESIAVASGARSYDASVSQEVSPTSPALAAVSGCLPLVFAMTREVSNLRIWRQHETDAGTLNIMELASRALQVQQQIDRYQLESSSPGLASEILQLTDVYTHATQLHLHTTASGAFPNVPGVRKSVEDVISAVRRLSSGRQLQRLAWPVCVAASMAGKEHDAFFNGLDRGAQGDQDGCLSLIRGLAVAQECQRLRRCEQDGARLQQRPCDWIEAMRSLEKDWVLL